MAEARPKRDQSEFVRTGLAQWPVTTDLWDPLITGTREWYSRCNSTVFSLNKQWLEFLQKRIEQDLLLPQRFFECRTPVGAWRIYVDYLQKAVADYQGELAELGRLGLIAETERETPASPSISGAAEESRPTVQ